MISFENLKINSVRCLIARDKVTVTVERSAGALNSIYRHEPNFGFLENTVPNARNSKERSRSVAYRVVRRIAIISGLSHGLEKPQRPAVRIAGDFPTFEPP